MLAGFLFVLNAAAALGWPTAVDVDAHHFDGGDSATDLYDCLANITRTYFDRRTTYLCLADFDAATADALARAVQSPKMILPYTSLPADAQPNSVFAFLAEDRLHARLLNVTRQSHFVAVWTQQRPMNHVRRLFREFWTASRLVNVIALVAMDDGTVSVFTYRPFSSYGCNKLGRPFLLDRWTDGAFRWGTDLFSRRPKTGNMHGCPLRCVGNEHPPDSVLRHDGHRWTASGVGGTMLDIVARHMNFTPVITTPKGNQTEAYSWYHIADVLDRIAAMLYADEADLAFGWYSYATYNDYANTELAKTTSIDCLGWAVPYRAGARRPSWTNYVYEFDRIGWLFIGSMFVIVIGVFYFFRKLNKLHRMDSVVFFVYHTTVDQPLRVQPVWCSLRTFMIHWLWYCMVISVAYKASLGSFMTVPAHGIEFTRVDQILASDLVTMGSPRSLHIMNATTATTRISRAFMKRMQRLPPTDFERVIDRLVVKRDIALFEVKRFMYYFSVPQAKRIKVKIPIRFLPGCLLRSHSTQFMFNGGSYLTEPVDAVLSTLFETGIVDHWIMHLGSNKVLPLEKIRGRVLRIVWLREAFLFLFFSYTIAFAVLIGEICWSKGLHRRLFFATTTDDKDDDDDPGRRQRDRQLASPRPVFPFVR